MGAPASQCDTSGQGKLLIMSAKVYPAYDGSETCTALVCAEGLRGKWLVHAVPQPNSKDVNIEDTSLDLSLLYAGIRTRYLDGFEFGLILQTCPVGGPKTIATRYRAAIGQMVVMCGSHDNLKWQWRGIYEWDDSCIPIPPSQNHGDLDCVKFHSVRLFGLFRKALEHMAHVASRSDRLTCQPSRDRPLL